MLGIVPSEALPVQTSVGFVGVPALVPRVVIVPVAVVEIPVIVGYLVAVQPVDRHAGPGGAGVIPRGHARRAAHRPETATEGPDRRMSRRRPVLHEAVVVGDVRGFGRGPGPR